MSSKITIRAFYRFVDLPDYEAMRAPLKDFCLKHNLKGTILLAKEGINSTISGTQADMDALFAYFNQDQRLAHLEYKEHSADYKPFTRMKVRLKQEIVRLAVDGIDMAQRGDYVDSDAWDALLDDPDVKVIDTRNHYEYQLGTFENAIDPMTDEFRSLPKWIRENLDPARDKKVAMFCTGGIRCEKSTALLKQLGFEGVYHLKGGILKYLEDKKGQTSKWQGDCFVFDDRIAVTKELEPTQAPLCKYCQNPVTIDAITHDVNNRGIACGDCA